MADLVLYTDSFPFYNAETFLETELLYLSDTFDTIFIKPLSGDGRRRKLPVNVHVLEPVATTNCPKITMYLLGFVNLLILFSEKPLRRELSSVSFLKALKYLGYGIWLKNKIEKNLLNKRVVHYSYWMNYWTVALALLSRKKLITDFVSRAHRFDLYTGTGEPALDFFKSFTINYLKKLYLVSENGLNFLNKRYPEYSYKYSLSRLGTSDPGFNGFQFNSESLVLVSCSNLKPLKRVDLILEALKILNHIHPELFVKWFHIGDGDTLEQLINIAGEKLGETRVQCTFKGSLSNSEVIEFYRNQPVDIFLNVSETEGIPVSIMEAQSFGIPVIATSVGGTPEIVNNLNGLLLDVNIQPEDLATILYNVYIEKESWDSKGICSRTSWELNFNAKTNYRSFALDLVGLQKTLG